MSVYINDDPVFFQEALDSILNQSLVPSEIVLVKNGPLSFELDNVITKYIADFNVFKIVTIDENVGLTKALNVGLKECKYDLIARMDSDDISLYERFELQISYLIDNPDITCVSAPVIEFDPNNLLVDYIRHLPEKHDEISNFSAWRSPMNHPCTTFRKSHILSVGAYPIISENSGGLEDWALWCKLITKGYKLSNMNKPLLRMRAGNDLYLRRGTAFFNHELSILWYLFSIKHISLLKLFINILMRLPLRLSPVFVRRFIYLNFR